jgi:hypothetical protein
VTVGEAAGASWRLQSAIGDSINRSYRGVKHMRERDPVLNMLVSQEHFETIDRYDFDRRDFVDSVMTQLPPEWAAQRRGTWYYCTPPQSVLPDQGWKIHASATPATAAPVLQRVTALLIARGVAFKFLIDRRIHAIANGKLAARGMSGKFITVYPTSREQFVSLLEELHAATVGLEGPYILSDRRYRDSRVLYYRYGAIAARHHVALRGEHVSPLHDPEGVEVADRRDPQFVLPPWETDPVVGPEVIEDAPAEVTLKDGRYRIINALAFKNSGGVYLAHDTERNERVVIKEARPNVHSTAEDPDAVALLSKEHRILTKLAGRCTPLALDWFLDWEHAFLVEEYLNCLTLGQFWVRHQPLLSRRINSEQLRQYWEHYKTVGLAVARVLQQSHEAGIIIGDVSAQNILVDNDLSRVRLIDLEAAFEPGVDTPIRLFTPEYMAPECGGGGFANESTDRYAFGMLLLASTFPITGLKRLDAALPEKLLAEMEVDLGLPARVRTLIERLVATNPAARPDWPEVMDELAAIDVTRHAGRPVREAVTFWERDIIDEACRYVESVATFDRDDQLFPCDHYAIGTNPLSLGYGAAGVGWALHQCERPVAPRVAQWVSDWLPRTPMPPGIMSGYAGVACALFDMGSRDTARQALQAANQHPLVHANCDLLNGFAGIGAANLYFYHHLREPAQLEAALAMAGRIRSLAHHDGDRAHWKGDNDVYFGLGEGAAGVSAFLLQLFKETHDQQWLDLGLAGLRFDLAHADQTADGGWSWRQALNGSRAILPYWGAGSAGIGSVLARYVQTVNEPWLADALERAWIDTDRKWAVFPGMFSGLSGIGQFHLDMHALTGDGKYLKAAERTASALRVFAVDRGERGIAFPGHRLLRLTCDLSTGAAGVILFLNRLVTRGQGRNLDWFWPGDRPEASVPATPNTAAVGQEVLI